MHPSTREKQVHGMAAMAAQIAVAELQNGHGSERLFDLDVSSGHDDFLDEILSGLATSEDASASDRQWIVGIGDIPEEGLQYAPFDESTLLTNRLWQYQISGGSSSAEKTMMLPLGHDCQQQVLVAGSGNSGLRPLPMTLARAGSIDSPNSTKVVDAIYNGFGGAILHTDSANQHSLPHLKGASTQGQNCGSVNPVASVTTGSSTAPPRQKVRARRGQATDPHSIAERLRRERIAERMKVLQELVPNANKTDKASMLDEIIDYVKFLQLQVKVLSMSRLGGAAAAAPLIGGADMPHEVQNGDGLTVTEQQVAKLMEEDMGSAMQYLQGKGLCLMPISLASAISSATGVSSFPRPLSSSSSAAHGHLLSLPNSGAGDAPSASALSAHSSMTNVGAAAKEYVVASKA